VHELRNPLSAMRAAIEVVQRADGSPQHNACLVLERQTKHMTRLIDDVFDVARGQLRGLSLQRERVDLAAVIEQALESTAPLVRARNHALAVDAPAGLWVHGDATRLTQVICNLVGNAAKYTHDGGSIRIVASRTDSEVAVVISDTGMGIPRELQPRIFENFVRAPEAERRSQAGLGVGLHIVRTLMRLHGGSVEVQSEGPGLGSKFTIHLPSEPRAVQAMAAAE
jgi:signal transduction histidine kinase